MYIALISFYLITRTIQIQLKIKIISYTTTIPLLLLKQCKRLFIYDAFLKLKVKSQIMHIKQTTSLTVK